jgi:Zn-dependent peptidase ImmA (M78 family)
MFSIKETLFFRDKAKFKDIEQKAYYELSELNSNQRVKDDIFRILKNINGVHLIKFPIEDENLTAFKIQKDKKVFIFINSAVPLEKQIFGGAHELYHTLYNETDLEEDFFSSFEKSYDNDDLIEMQANSFAACFLVRKDHLMQEVHKLNITNNNIELIDIIKLMDIFAVPYKTMVLRLYECEVIEGEQATYLLQKKDRDPKKDVLLLINQTRNAIKWQNLTDENEFGNLIELSLRNYKESIITKEKIEKDLEKINFDGKIEDFLENND